MDREEIQKLVKETEEEFSREFEEINNYIFMHPELGLKEYQSSKYLVKYLKKKGFEVEYPYAGFETAFRAEYGEKGPKIAFLAEYDALPGYGKDKVNAHACGHNWIASTAVGAAVVLAELADKIGARVVLIGTPAEETYGSKVEMVNLGVFEDIDIAMQAHLSHATSTCNVALAMDAFVFNYEGKASHSAGAPWNGINALDAVHLLYAGINALRQHVMPDTRIHGIVTEGGRAANTVPEKASAMFYVRSSTREYLNTLIPKIENIAKGAALMTGAKLEISKPELPFYNLVNLPILQELANTYFELNGMKPTVTPEMAALAAGSTDIGNVSRACPTMYVEVSLDGEEVFFAHEESTLKLVDGFEARKKMHQTIQAMAGAALELITHPDMLETAKKQLLEKKANY